MRINRELNELREINIQRKYTMHASGSVLISIGNTQVICSAYLLDSVPHFLRDKSQGWLTAEYGMLPSATTTRFSREAARGKQTGRTVEIQRLIGRTLRAIVDLNKMPNYTLQVDCDVIQADGGTRCASITGAAVAVKDALTYGMEKGYFKENPFKGLVAATSVGICNGNCILDLEYSEDSIAETDMNIIMNEQGEFIEIQGTAEKGSFSPDQLSVMLTLADKGIKTLIEKQQQSFA